MPINHRRRFLRIASLGLGLCLGAGVFSTQAAASSCGIEKPVKVIVGYGAGGGIELPFGGVRKSGHGREKGFAALYDFSQLKTVVQNHG